MAAIGNPQSNKPSKRKSIRQKQSRRKTNMMKKASEYSKMCNADVCVGIRMRETGQIHILSADTSGFWAFLRLQLVCKHKMTQFIRMNADLPELPLPDPDIDDRWRFKESQRPSF
jgi:hypothetical protein